MGCVFRMDVIQYEHLSPDVGERGRGMKEGLHQSLPGGVLRVGHNYDGLRGTQASLGTAELPGRDLQLHLVCAYSGLHCVPPKDTFKSSPMIPVTGTCFGNEVVAGGMSGAGGADIQIRKGKLGSQRGGGCAKARRQTDTLGDRRTQAEGHGAVEGEVGGKHPETQERHRWPATPEPGARPGTESPSEPPEEALAARGPLLVLTSHLVSGPLW
ncbi:hypothetical protein HJG60_010456 [Phyllostomus discolor]|uniref:Uncharacterized protein n=1 Tax=Phyllostomus discolor TaxID=89673 RepID=A0A834EHF1_9CHIR|nr:hypothetical protein HJG60_010456 [Phyllostomus discolor]